MDSTWCSSKGWGARMIINVAHMRKKMSFFLVCHMIPVYLDLCRTAKCFSSVRCAYALHHHEGSGQLGSFLRKSTKELIHILVPESYSFSSV